MKFYVCDVKAGLVIGNMKSIDDVIAYLTSGQNYVDSVDRLLDESMIKTHYQSSADRRYFEIYRIPLNVIKVFWKTD